MSGTPTKFAFIETKLVVLLLVLTAPVVAQSDTSTAAKHLFEQQRWDEAAKAFQQIESEQPQQTSAPLFLAKSLLHLNRLAEADSALETYIKQHAGSDEALYLLAYVRFRENRPAESLELSTRAARIKTPNSDDLKVVGLDYVLLQDRPSAIRYLRMAVAMKPTNIEALYALGRVLYEENQFDAAIQTFTAVLRFDSANVKAQDNLGLCYEGKNDNESALAAYRKAMEMDGHTEHHSAWPYLNQGILLAKTNQTSEALPLLQRAVQIDPSNAKAHLELGRTYTTLNRFAEAAIELEESIRLKDEGGTHYLLGRAYARLGEADLAKREFELTDQYMKAKSAKSGMAHMSEKRQAE